MAIVFDTQAELEAFCEMFELRNMVQERPTRKFSRKFIQNAKATEKAERVAQETKSLPQLEAVPVLEAESTDLEMELHAAGTGEPTFLLASAS